METLCLYQMAPIGFDGALEADGTVLYFCSEHCRSVIAQNGGCWQAGTSPDAIPGTVCDECEKTIRDDHSRSINDFTDAELAAMVRNSIYAKNARFGDGPNDSRFLLVMAVPYGNDDCVTELAEAIEGFIRLLSEDDSDERDFQVYDHKLPASYESRFFSTSLQDLDNIEEIEEGNEVSE